MTKTRDLANLANGVTSANIVDGAITNVDVNNSAGITSSKFNFTQSGTGATTRTVESKLRDVVSVKDFGAVGDGVTDDTAYFAAAFAALNAATKPLALYIPAGNYLVNPNTCNITTSYRSVFGDGLASRIIVPSSGNGISVNGTSDTVHLTNVAIYNLSVVASGWTGTGGTNAIQINKANNCSVTKCFVEGVNPVFSWEQGIILRDTNSCLIANNVIRYVKGNGISLDLLLGTEDTKGNLVTGNTIADVGDSGIGFHNNVRYSAAIGNNINNPGQGAGTGIDIAGCNYCLFKGNVISNSGQYGIRLLQNLSYRTVDNVVTGNTIYHPSTAGEFGAITIDNTERNTITYNRILGNSATLSNRAIFITYSSTGTNTHPITGESLYKIRGTVIANNTVDRFEYGTVFDAAGGITGATLSLDNNVFQSCDYGIVFNTGVSEIRFTTYGHNTFLNCTTNVVSINSGIVQNGDPLSELLTTTPVNVSTTGSETDVTSLALPAISGQNVSLVATHRVSEVGAYDGRINYKDSTGATLAADTFGEVTNSLRPLTVPFISSGLLVVTIEKSGPGPFTGTVDCNGLYLTKYTYY